MRLAFIAGLVATTLVAAAAPAAAGFVTFTALAEVLTLHMDGTPRALSALATRERGLDAGERQLLDETLADPLALLELEEVPPKLLGLLTLRQLGPIHGARVADVPTDTALAAIALGGGPVAADELRSFHSHASIRNEDPDAQQVDLEALWAGLHG